MTAPPTPTTQQTRLDAAAEEARAAELRGDVTASDAWRRYRLIADSLRDPDELLAEGIELSCFALELAAANSGE